MFQLTLHQTNYILIRFGLVEDTWELTPGRNGLQSIPTPADFNRAIKELNGKLYPMYLFNLILA